MKDKQFYRDVVASVEALASSLPLEHYELLENLLHSHIANILYSANDEGVSLGYILNDIHSYLED